uniref:Uncharacterized protein n=1 Tax=Anguilla anguilla TaxID=7936 RepID=A0A0E9QYA7_ANGAN
MQLTLIPSHTIILHYCCARYNSKAAYERT